MKTWWPLPRLHTNPETDEYLGNVPASRLELDKSSGCPIPADNGLVLYTPMGNR